MHKKLSKLKSNNSSNLAVFKGDVIIASPLGSLGLTFNNLKLQKVSFLKKATPTSGILPSHIRQVTQALDAYFDDPHHPFDLDLDLMGTPFQQSVWRLLVSIPLGQTLTYGDLAKKLNSSPRAVGGALKANPCPVVIPCHRVISKTGLGGFSGETTGPKMAIKTWLLKHEGLSLL